MSSLPHSTFAKAKLTIAFFLAATISSLLAGNYHVVLMTADGTDLYSTDSIAAVSLDVDSVTLRFCNSKSVGYRSTSIQRLYFGHDVVDYVITWNGDRAILDRDVAIPGLDIAIDGAQVEIVNNSRRTLHFTLTGYTSDGCVLCTGPGPVDLTLDNVSITNSAGSAIAVYSDSTTRIHLIGENALYDGKTRPAEIRDIQRASLCSVGSLTFDGQGTLKLAGNFKHAVYSAGDIVMDSCRIKINQTESDGIRAKGHVDITDCNLEIHRIKGNAVNADDGSFTATGSTFDLLLSKNNTNGIKSNGPLSLRECEVSLAINGNQCKGIKSSGAITILNSRISGKATGNVVIKNGDTSYCTFIKSDDDLTVLDSDISLTHTGKGGRGLSARHDLAFIDSSLDASFACDGEEYVNTENSVDYYTSRILDTDNDMKLVSGRISILQTGLGGKGISCGNKLEIGRMYAESDSTMLIDVETTASCIVNDTVMDLRFGCPKAIKSKGNLYVYSGIVHARTHGMGGEGIECGRYMKVEGGEIICETFDDGINPGKGIKFNGGKVFVFSSDNDGIDSNGDLSINGGIVVATNAHFRDEDFDCDEGRDFSINGGTVLGVARDFSRPTIVNQPYVQHTPALWRPDYSGKDSVNVVDFHKDDIVVIADECSRPIISVKLQRDVPAAFITASAASFLEGLPVNIFCFRDPPGGSLPILDRKVFLGGDIILDEPILSILATKEILGVTN